jgi:hypothetical protein
MFWNKKRKQLPRDYSCLPEMAAIITNNDAKAIEDARVLARGVTEFKAAHKIWAEDIMEWTGENIMAIFAYWFAGYCPNDVPENERPTVFGAYNDWKDNIYFILLELEDPIKNLGYPLDLSEFHYDEDSDLIHEDAMPIINENFGKKGYRLVNLDGCGDCMHFFIIHAEDYDRLVSLIGTIGEKLGYKWE